VYEPLGVASAASGFGGAGGVGGLTGSLPKKFSERSAHERIRLAWRIMF